MFVRFSQQILSGKLLLAVTGGQKSNLSGGFKIRTNNNLPPYICCESVVKMLWALLDVICYMLSAYIAFCLLLYLLCLSLLVESNIHSFEFLFRHCYFTCMASWFIEKGNNLSTQKKYKQRFCFDDTQVEL